MCVRPVRVECQHLSVSVRAVLQRHVCVRGGGGAQFFLAQSHEGTVKPQSVLFVDVIVVLHDFPFGSPAQSGLRDDQETPGKLQHGHRLPRGGLAQTQVQQSGHWTRQRTGVNIC